MFRRFAHAFIIFLLIASACYPASGALPRMYEAQSGRDALIAAKASGKPVMVYFWQPGCGWCAVVENLLATSDFRFALVQHYHFIDVNTTLSGPVVDGLKKVFKVKGTPAFAFLSPKAEPICMVYGNIKDDAELSRIDANVLSLARGGTARTMTSAGFPSCRGEVTEDDSKVTVAKEQ